ncbi:hypothetical protein [Flavobacterium sp.]|uniref:hypothetical protein n=1 Tax=Flavobacterium sp. TaxID=239 RepID=UPI0025B99EB1|nr:hypothetical protein [Flavobacterium sp.]
MKKLSLEWALENLKKVSKVGIYILAGVKILDFAIETLDGLKEKPEVQKEVENE